MNAHRDLIQAAAGILGLSVLGKSEHLKIGETQEQQLTVISTNWDKPLLFHVPLTEKPKSMVLALSFKASFELVGASWTMRTSSVTASYWTPKTERDASGTLKTHHRHSHSLHFDYHHYPHVAGRAIHPRFHLQPSLRIVGDKTAHFRKPDKNVLTSVGNPRVPTPPLDLPAVIEMLYADHFPQVVKAQTMKPWVNARNALPRLPVETCKTHAAGRQACCFYDGCLEVLMT